MLNFLIHFEKKWNRGDSGLRMFERFLWISGIFYTTHQHTHLIQNMSHKKKRKAEAALIEWNHESYIFTLVAVQ